METNIFPYAETVGGLLKFLEKFAVDETAPIFVDVGKAKLVKASRFTVEANSSGSFQVTIHTL